MHTVAIGGTMTENQTFTRTEVRESLMRLVQEGRVLALPQPDGVTFKAVVHATPAEIARALTPEQVAGYFLSNPLEEHDAH